jgi:hypothetical protein
MNNPLRQLKCDWRADCTNPISHIDEKGYVYCMDHGRVRQGSMRCRKLTQPEIKRLLNGQPLERY